MKIFQEKKKYEIFISRPLENIQFTNYDEKDHKFHHQFN